MSSLTALLKRPPASQLQGDFFGSSSRQGPCLAAAGLEQLKKTADQFLKEQQATKNAVELYKQKAQESEAACSRLELLHKKEQAENARLKAKLSGDEKQVHDVLQQILQVRCMHDSLLQTVGEANKHLVEVNQQREHLSVAFDERFSLCEDAVKDAGAKLLISKDEEICQLNSKIQEVLQGKAQEKQRLEGAIAILEQGNCEQTKKIQELDAEIKHAFQDLQHKEEQCKELSSRLEGMAAELQDTRKQLDIAAGDIQSKDREYQAALSAHQQHMKCKDEWSNKESKWQAEIKEANKKQQQLADRTALELDKLRTAHRDDLAKLQEKANAGASEMTGKVSSMAAELTAMRAEKAQMEACYEENAKSKKQIEALTNKVASLLSINEQTKTELEQVNHEKEARLAEALEQAANNAEQVTCLTAQLKELEFDKKQLSTQKEQMLKEHSEEREASLKQLRQQCDSQMSVLNERLAQQIALAEQQRAEGQAAEQSLQEELDKRDAVTLQIQEELRQKDMLLQQISMAAAPDPPAIPSTVKRKVATPARPARSEQEGSQDSDADEEADSPHPIARRFHDGLHQPGISKHSPMNIAQKRPSPIGQAVCSRDVPDKGRPIRNRNRSRTALPQSEYEHDLHSEFPAGVDDDADATTGDDSDDEEYTQGIRNKFRTRGRQQKRKAPVSKQNMQQSKAKARAALAASVSKKGRFSTMSAHSLGSDDERRDVYHKASYEASTLGKRGYYNSAALDIFGNAALDPYCFHA
ncbi:g8892 [Coccomyxa elongata]